MKAVRHYTGSLSIPGIARPFDLTEETVRGAARKFLLAVQEAGRIYRHVEEWKSSPQYNPHFRQLLHVGFKVAAGMGRRFTDALEANEEIVGKNVTENLFDRHLQPIFA